MCSEQVSVIIPTWNGVRLLPPCLDSLRAQTRAPLEIIAVDNASEDGTRVLLQQSYPEVQTIALATNRGFSAAVNAGIARARGTLVALLNQDVQVAPQWLEEAQRAAESHPDVGAIACKIMLHDRRTRFHSAGDQYRRNGIPVNRGVWQEDVGQYDTESTVFGACGGVALYRAELFQHIGTFDETFFMYLEDVDLAWRQQLAGWPTLYAPRAVAYHRLSASGGGVTASYYSGRNTLYVIAKNMPGKLLRKYAGRIIAAQWAVTRDALRAWRGQAARARLRGQIAGILGWPRLMGKRRAVQSSRRVSIEYLDRLLID